MIAINPFKTVSIYDKDAVQRYQATHTTRDPLPPHIFLVADRAYYALVRNTASQVVGTRVEQRMPRRMPVGMRMRMRMTMRRRGKM